MDKKRKQDSIEHSSSDFVTLNTTTNHILFKRQFAHVEGNWPSYVYFLINNKEQQFNLFAKSCIRQFLLKSNNSNLSRTNIVEEDTSSLHLSLSRPFVLRHHQIQSFLRILHKALITCPELPLELEVYAEYEVLTNDTKTRSFISIPFEDRLKSLQAIVTKGVDVALADMRQPLYYENPKFHVSIASFVCEDTPVKGIDDASMRSSDTRLSSSPPKESSNRVRSHVTDHTYPVSSKVLSDIRKQMKEEGTYDDEDSDSDSDRDRDSEDGISDHDNDNNNKGEDAVKGGTEETRDDGSNEAQYYGSTILQLDCIECKVGNKKYRYSKARGFIEV